MQKKIPKWLPTWPSKWYLSLSSPNFVKGTFLPKHLFLEVSMLGNLFSVFPTNSYRNEEILNEKKFFWAIFWRSRPFYEVSRKSYLVRQFLFSRPNIWHALSWIIGPGPLVGFFHFFALYWKYLVLRIAMSKTAKMWIFKSS